MAAQRLLMHTASFRDDMIDIFAIARESRHHSESPPGNRFSMAGIFHQVAVRDKDKTGRQQLCTQYHAVY